ncbi:MAG: aspartate dehydrogenase [Eubacteriales bacterium]|nr:aspartate dehydrogenase [Eubacteriales bacterium]
MLFFNKQKKSASSPSGARKYDNATMEPVIRCGICTGEQVAGFKNRETGNFMEAMLIRNPEDLKTFRRQYGIPEEEELRRIY